MGLESCISNKFPRDANASSRGINFQGIVLLCRVETGLQPMGRGKSMGRVCLPFIVLSQEVAHIISFLFHWQEFSLTAGEAGKCSVAE